MIRGPKDYIPAVEADVMLRRKSIPLDVNEGIYVRDVKTGKIRSVIGKTYLLTENEELWEKELPAHVEQLLGQDPRYAEDKSSAIPPRDKSKVVTYRVPHNACVQIYDYKAKKARIIFGPELVMLGPDEQFTILNLSGEKPKVPNKIRTICLLLGPEFSSDIVTIESSDHARLSLRLSYNWHFQINDINDEKEVAKLFSVPDFIGDFCKAIAAKVRGAVASISFDDFHKNSAKIIRTSVFGLNETKHVNKRLVFPQNNLVLTSIDIQSVEPVDQRTRDALQKSVQLAIEVRKIFDLIDN
jgi:major vault protein